MNTKLLVVLTMLGCRASAGAAPALDPLTALDPFNVVWNSPSENAHGSMPLGNGDVGINAWVEANGDLIFYVSKTDAWNEDSRLCKIGRIRVKFDPPLAVKDGFRQELKLRDGVIEIETGKQKANAKIRLWVDAARPVVRMDAESTAPVSCRAEVELWRLRELPVSDIDEYSHGDGKNPLAQSYNLKTLPDVVVTDAGPQVVWYHRNTRSVFPVCLEVQHLEALKDKFADPLLNHTFGASLRGVDMVPDGANALRSNKPATRQQLAVCVLAERAESPEAWRKDLEILERIALQSGFDQSLLSTSKWWQAFWNRSWVFVDAKEGVCIHRYWSGGMELTAIMLDRYDFTQDEAFARNTLVPLADPIIAFFDQYWPKRDSNKKTALIPRSRSRPCRGRSIRCLRLRACASSCRACWLYQNQPPRRCSGRAGRGCWMRCRRCRSPRSKG